MCAIKLKMKHLESLRGLSGKIGPLRGSDDLDKSFLHVALFHMWLLEFLHCCFFSLDFIIFHSYKSPWFNYFLRAA